LGDRPNNADVLRLREACNKIIHATDIRFDVVVPDAATNPDEDLPVSRAAGSANMHRGAVKADCGSNCCGRHWFFFLMGGYLPWSSPTC